VVWAGARQACTACHCSAWLLYACRHSHGTILAAVQGLLTGCCKHSHARAVGGGWWGAGCGFEVLAEVQGSAPAALWHLSTQLWM
jgi:hypothetical protein